jgi:hypothetical protein
VGRRGYPPESRCSVLELRRLGIDHIDLYQMNRPDPTTDIEESLSALTDLRRAGKVIYIASSTFSAAEMVEAHTGMSSMVGSENSSMPGMDACHTSAWARAASACYPSTSTPWSRSSLSRAARPTRSRQPARLWTSWRSARWPSR